RLHFDRQELAICLDHEVHFLADSRAPIAKLRVLDARIAPGEEIVQHQVLQVHATRLRPGQVQRDAGITPVDLWCLDEPLGAVDGIGRQANEQMRGLQRVEPAVHQGRRARRSGASEPGAASGRFVALTYAPPSYRDGTGGFWLAAGCASISRSNAKIHKPNHDTMGRSAAPPCRFATSAPAHIRSLPRISFTRTARLNRLSAENDAMETAAATCRV